MKLAKKTRKRLYEAEGEPIEITWPASAPEALRGHKYPVYTKEGKAFSIRIESVKRGAKIKAVVKIDADPYRPLFGISGVRTDLGDYESEPERVYPEYEAKRALEASAPSALCAAEHRTQEKAQGKEARSPASPRAERAVRRHQQAIERALRSAA